MQKVILKLKNKIPSLLAILVGCYLIVLFIVGKIAFYISPSYFIFNLIMGLILFNFGLITLFAKTNPHENVRTREILPFIILLILIPLLPQPLSSATAGNRTLNQASGESIIESNPLLQKDTTVYSIADWAKTLNYNPKLENFIGKNVDVTGFVFYNSNFTSSTENFLVGRFVITCCAVDAAPIGLEVENLTAAGKWSDQFSSDDWVRVQGQWKWSQKQDKLIIEAVNISPASVPDNPYE